MIASKEMPQVRLNDRSWPKFGYLGQKFRDNSNIGLGYLEYQKERSEVLKHHFLLHVSKRPLRYVSGRETISHQNKLMLHVAREFDRVCTQRTRISWYVETYIDIFFKTWLPAAQVSSQVFVLCLDFPAQTSQIFWYFARKLNPIDTTQTMTLKIDCEGLRGYLAPLAVYEKNAFLPRTLQVIS